MSHTPEQAAELWCPMVRLTQFIGGHDSGGGNHLAGATYNRVHHGNFCIADKCAMWRFAVEYVPPADAEPGKIVSGVQVRAAWGYCGIAGRPEVTA